MKRSNGFAIAAVLATILIAIEGRPTYSTSQANLAPVADALSDARARLAYPPNLAEQVEQIQLATVTTASGVFERSVRVVSGTIHCIEWTADSCSPFYGTAIMNGAATGTTQHGQIATVQIKE